ncbi:MAG: hypothetical protein R3339_09135 [Thermodesulfobacteriota bacterium]|nr:hypothetical protein [Thermodesulfobacteriota bacterium]
MYYTEHSEQQTNRYRLLTERNNLLITGGSDFHGANMAGVELGTGRGSLHIPYSLFENLKTYWEEGKNKVC